LLFERQARGVRLTAAGRVLLEDVRRILLDVDEVSHRLRRVADGSLGTLRISFTENIVRRPLLYKAIARYRALAPDVELSFAPMISERQRHALRAREIDVGFVYQESGDIEEFHLRPFANDGLEVVLPVGHPLCEGDTVRIEDLAQDKLIWPSRRHSPRLYDRLMRACEARPFTPRIAIEVGSVDAACGLVAAGLGIAIVVGPPPYTEISDVVFRPLKDFNVSMPLSMIWTDEASPAIAKFVDVVSDPDAAPQS
jgi:DNA-binding transcriptional LysR family regulator